MRQVLLGSVADFNPRLNGMVADDVTFVPMAAVSTKGALDVSLRRPFEEVRRGFTPFARGDVLFAKITPCMENGKSAWARDLPTEMGFGSTEFHVLRPHSELLGSYLHHFLRQRDFLLRAAQNMSGTGGQRRLPIEYLAKQTIRLPSRDEQQRIVKLLESAFRVVLAISRQQELSKELVSATFDETFGDPVVNTKGWPTTTFSKLCGEGDIVDGPFGSSLKPESYVPSGVRVIRNVNVQPLEFDGSDFKFVTPEKFEALTRSAVRHDDVLLTIKGSVGRVCVMPKLDGPSVLSASGTVRLRLPRVRARPEFVAAQMSTAAYQRYLHSFEAGTAQKYINLSMIRGLSLVVPPIEMQDRFVTAFTHIRALKAKLTASLAEAEALYQALSHQYFGF